MAGQLDAPEELDVDAGSDVQDLSGDPDWSFDRERGNVTEEEKMSKITFEETEENVLELVDSWGIVKGGSTATPSVSFGRRSLLRTCALLSR